MKKSLKMTHIRLIPARAGNISAMMECLDSMSAHPRSRGEHHFHAPRSSPSNGSSPLARGTFHAEERERGLIRLIPARAGNIRWSYS